MLDVWIHRSQPMDVRTRHPMSAHIHPPNLEFLHVCTKLTRTVWVSHSLQSPYMSKTRGLDLPKNKCGPLWLQIVTHCQNCHHNTHQSQRDPLKEVMEQVKLVSNWDEFKSHKWTIMNMRISLFLKNKLPFATLPKVEKPYEDTFPTLVPGFKKF